MSASSTKKDTISQPMILAASTVPGMFMARLCALARLSARQRSPLVLENRKIDLCGPFALEPLVLDEHGFLPHAEPAQHRGGRVVALVDATDHAMQLEPVEGEFEQRAAG